MARSARSSRDLLRGEALGRQLRQARTSQGLAREEVARRAGLSVETLRKIEQGKTAAPELFTVHALAQALGLSLDAITVAAVAEVNH